MREATPTRLQAPKIDTADPTKFTRQAQRNSAESPPMRMLPQPAPSGEILSIQYLRAVAALMVVWHHAINQVPGMLAWAPWQFGTSGVDLFFVISGFIMVVTTMRSSIRPVDFWRRRIVRVVPLYWSLTLLMVALALAMPSLFKTLKVAPLTLIESLLFVPHFSQSFPQFVWPLLVPGWTLNFEMFFYALFGATLVLPRRRGRVALTVVLAGLVGMGAVLGPFDSAGAQTYTHPMLLEFLAGVWIGTLWSEGRLSIRGFWVVPMLVAGTALLVLRDQPPLGPLTQLAGASLLVVAALQQGCSAWRSRILLGIGNSSYSLYLTHIFTLGVLRVVWVRCAPSSPHGIETTMFLVGALGSCALVGWLVFRWIETPLMQSLRRLTAWRDATRPASTEAPKEP